MNLQFSIVEMTNYNFNDIKLYELYEIHAIICKNSISMCSLFGAKLDMTIFSTQ